MGSDGNFGDILHMPGGGCALPVTKANIDQRVNTVHMNGRETFKQAVTSMLAAANKALEQSGLAVDDLTCIIPHQANLRIIEALAERLGVSLSKFQVNLDRYGNTSAAAVAIAWMRSSRRPLQGWRLYLDGGLWRRAHLRQLGCAVVDNRVG